MSKNAIGWILGLSAALGLGWLFVSNRDKTNNGFVAISLPDTNYRLKYSKQNDKIVFGYSYLTSSQSATVMNGTTTAFNIWGKYKVSIISSGNSFNITVLDLSNNNNIVASRVV